MTQTGTKKHVPRVLGGPGVRLECGKNYGAKCSDSVPEIAA